MPKTLEADQERLLFGLEFTREISSFRPYSPINYTLTKRMLYSLKVTSRTADWGLAMDKFKLKAAVVDILVISTRSLPGDPANLKSCQMRAQVVQGSHKTAEAHPERRKGRQQVEMSLKGQHQKKASPGKPWRCARFCSFSLLSCGS